MRADVVIDDVIAYGEVPNWNLRRSKPRRKCAASNDHAYTMIRPESTWTWGPSLLEVS